MTPTSPRQFDAALSASVLLRMQAIEMDALCLTAIAVYSLIDPPLAGGSKIGSFLPTTQLINRLEGST